MLWRRLQIAGGQVWYNRAIAKLLPFFSTINCLSLWNWRPKTKKLCRVPGHGTRQRVSLPSASHQALGKECFIFFLNFLFAECIHRSTRQRNNKKNLNLCRVPSRGHSAKYFKNKKKFFAERQIWDARQRIFWKKKLNLCRVPDPGHSAKKVFCRVPPIWHSAK